MLLRIIISWIRYAILRIVPLAFFRIKKNNSGTYISLTSTPSRINKISWTLKSLIHQSQPPESIIVNIPHKSLKGIEYHIPDYLTKHPSIIIQRCEDLGPATKLLPTLKRLENEDVTIVVVDDDQVYPRHLIENYLLKQKKYPKTALGLCGWKAPKNLDHHDKNPLRGAGLKFFKPYHNIDNDVEVDILQGASSYLVKPSFFNNNIFDLTESAFAADDIWTSGQLAKNNVDRKVVIINDPYCRLATANNSKNKESLKNTVNKDNKHNNELYKYFEKDWRY